MTICTNEDPQYDAIFHRHTQCTVIDETGVTFRCTACGKEYTNGYSDPLRYHIGQSFDLLDQVDPQSTKAVE